MNAIARSLTCRHITRYIVFSNWGDGIIKGLSNRQVSTVIRVKMND